MIGPVFDDADAEILAIRNIGRAKLRAKVKRALVGDIVDLLDGTRRRFTHDHRDRLQTNMGPDWKYGPGSFHLTENGDGSYSGALDPAIKVAELVDTGETAAAVFWFFHHGQWRAHNGVNVEIPVKVWRQVAP